MNIVSKRLILGSLVCDVLYDKAHCDQVLQYHIYYNLQDKVAIDKCNFIPIPIEQVVVSNDTPIIYSQMKTLLEKYTFETCDNLSSDVCTIIRNPKGTKLARVEGDDFKVNVEIDRYSKIISVAYCLDYNDPTGLLYKWRSQTPGVTLVTTGESGGIHIQFK